LRKNCLACRGAPQGLSQAKDLIGVADDSTIEDWFSKLGDSRRSIRPQAGMKIAEHHAAEGGKIYAQCFDFGDTLILIALLGEDQA
jgi:hypothetical protein